MQNETARKQNLTAEHYKQQQHDEHEEIRSK